MENNDITKTLDSIQQLNINFENPEEGDLFKVFGALLEMPDEQFNIIAPYVLTEMQATLKDSNTKLALIESLKEQGITTDQLLDSAASIAEALDEVTAELSLSQNKVDFIKQITMLTYNALNDSELIGENIVRIPIELCHPEAKIPTYANPTDAGMDIYAIEDITINPSETVLVSTGLKVAIPSGYEIQVRPKSGRALKTKMRVANSPGTIDSGYRDEIKVIIDNIEPAFKDIEYHFDDNGKIIIDSILHGSAMHITKGDKFAQLVLNKLPKTSFYQIETVSEYPNDGREGGFGSTGLK